MGSSVKSNRFAYISLVISILVFVLSIVAIILLIVNKTTAEVCFHYCDASITVLSILVTTLLGWNIWSVIDNRGLEEKLKKELIHIQNNADYNQATIYAILSQTLSVNFAGNNLEIIKMQMLLKGLTALKTYSNFPDCNIEIEKLVSSIIFGLNHSVEVKLPKQQKDELILLCGQINNKEIREFSTLFELINSIQTFDDPK